VVRKRRIRDQRNQGKVQRERKAVRREEDLGLRVKDQARKVKVGRVADHQGPVNEANEAAANTRGK